MQEHRYKTTTWKLIKQTAFTFIFLLVQIVLTILLYLEMDGTSKLWTLFLLTLFFSAMTIPSIILTMNYLQHSIGKDFIVTYDSLKFVDRTTEKIIEIKSVDVIRIERHTTISPNSFPWVFNEYFCVISHDKKVIYVTSYIMSLFEFRLDNLTSGVKEKEYKRYERILPTISRHSL